MGGANGTSVFAVGDVFPNIDDGRGAFTQLTPLMSRADVVFGNCEGIYSEQPSPAPSRRHFMGAPPQRGDMLAELPLHVVTCANNHILDGGYEGLTDTLALLTGQGIQVTGAGRSLSEATTPAVVERNGTRIAFLGFCSVFPVGHEARPDRPGLAPLRVRTFYADPDPSFWEPGIEPVVITMPLAADLERFRDSIASAREHADHVVVACHWGYSSQLETLQDYELQLARDAIEHGADAVVCHHHHSLRGIELHRGRPIFYGLGALIHHFDHPKLTPDEVAARRQKLGRLASFGWDDAFPLFPFHPDARMTGVAAIDFDDDDSVAGGLFPAEICADGSTVPLQADDPGASRIAAYVERLSEGSGLDTSFEMTERDGWAFVRAEAAG